MLTKVTPSMFEGSTGGGGAENYIGNPNAENDTTGWLVDSVSAATRPSGALTGTSTGLTFTRTTTNPLNGIASFLISKDAVNRQGRLAYYNLTLPAKSKAKVMSIRVPYRVVSGTFVAGSSSVDSDCIVYVRQYNGSTYTWSEPSSIKLLSNSTTLADEFRAEFQTLSDTISADLVFYVATTSASAWVLAIDDVNLGPSNYVYGTPITDWQSYTPTFTNLGTPTGVDVKWRRAGQSLEIQGRWTNGTVGAGDAAFTMPPGLTGNYGSGVIVGEYGHQGSATGSVLAYSALNNNLYFGMSNWAVPATGTQMTTSAFTSVNGSIQIVGWSSSVQMSDQTDTRIVDFVGTVTTQSLTANVTDMAVTTQKDSHGAWSGTAYLVPVAGDYEISSFVYSAATAFNTKIYVNTAFTRYIGYHAASFGGGGTVIIPNLKVGDSITVRSNTTATIANDNGQTLSISRLTGPAAIAASETVTAKFGTTSARTINNTTPTIVYENVLDDSHGAYNATTGEYRIYIPGRYLIAGGFAISGVATTVGHANILRVFKNGTIDTDIAGSVAQTTTAVVHRAYGATEVKCVAGDILTFRFYADTANTISAGAGNVSNHVSIARIGL